MLTAAQRFPDRPWAAERCDGIGRHPHRLVHDGDAVVDVRAKPSAQVRILATDNHHVEEGDDDLLCRWFANVILPGTAHRHRTRRSSRATAKNRP
ncbi:hypothetical protein ACQP1O_20460 [Nocardia sp. CA-151230]|uniref:hypothetical protein n=1 Tax=Nocardia sp. CA-151230 TaxID=3239982 RepID=UPI003D94AD59